LRAKETYGVGLLGLGVVGTQVARLLLSPPTTHSIVDSPQLELHRILVRDITKERSIDLPDGILTENIDELLSDENISVIVEVMGGEHPAFDYQQRALTANKHLVTANKEVIAKHGKYLLDLAKSSNLELRFEASVGGGIPIINPVQRDLIANKITSIRAIINGTTNFILTQMADSDIEFESALKQAQKLGYAEPDSTNDIEGIDAAYKLAILASIAFQTHISPEEIYQEGITNLQPRDFQYAKELGYAIKLLAIAKESDDILQVRVHPALVPLESSLATISGPFNAVEVQGDLTGPVVFIGQGAGAAPTSSAVIGDLIAIASHPSTTSSAPTSKSPKRKITVASIQDIETQYYLRLNVADCSGVLAQIGAVFGKHSISVASVIQKDSDPQAQSAELVITTHPALESSMQSALTDIRKLGILLEIRNVLRIEV